MLKQMLNPDLYHGGHPWNVFEGWYFKLTDAVENTFAFIPGISWSKSAKEAHSFIQVLEGPKGKYNYHSFLPEAFTAGQSAFSVSIDDNYFSLEELSLNIDTKDQQLKGRLCFSRHTKWHDSKFAPGSMGFFNFIPFMQCYSQVCAMSMAVEGELIIDGVSYCFDGGWGYVEKNWGRAFPYSWIWLQSNRFSDPSIALSCSIGKIPFLFGSFRGFLVGLWFNNDFISFTTMKGSRAKIHPLGRDVLLELQNDKYRLYIKSEADIKDFILCRGPRDGKMVPLVEECLKGRLYIHLLELSSGKILLEDVGRAAGIEYGGDMMRIFSKKK